MVLVMAIVGAVCGVGAVCCDLAESVIQTQYVEVSWRRRKRPWKLCGLSHGNGESYLFSFADNLLPSFFILYLHHRRLWFQPRSGWTGGVNICFYSSCFALYLSFLDGSHCCVYWLQFVLRSYLTFHHQSRSNIHFNLIQSWWCWLWLIIYFYWFTEGDALFETGSSINFTDRWTNDVPITHTTVLEASPVIHHHTGITLNDTSKATRVGGLNQLSCYFEVLKFYYHVGPCQPQGNLPQTGASLEVVPVPRWSILAGTMLCKVVMNEVTKGFQ